MEISCEWCGDWFFRTKRPLKAPRYGFNEFGRWRQLAQAGELAPAGRKPRFCSPSCRKADCVFRAELAALEGPTPALAAKLRGQRVRWFLEIRAGRKKAAAKRAARRSRSPG